MAQVLDRKVCRCRTPRRIKRGSPAACSGGAGGAGAPLKIMCTLVPPKPNELRATTSPGLRLSGSVTTCRVGHLLQKPSLWHAACLQCGTQDAGAHLQPALSQPLRLGRRGAEVQVGRHKAVLKGQQHLGQACAQHKSKPSLKGPCRSTAHAGQRCHPGEGSSVGVQGARLGFRHKHAHPPGQTRPRSGPCWT